MPTLAELREGLARNLSTIPGVQVSAYVLANPTPPAIEVAPGPVDYDQAMRRGTDLWLFNLRAIVGLTTDKGAQMRLDRLIAPSGDESVKAAVESDVTLGGVAQSLHVVRCSGYQVYERQGGAPYLGAEWEVHVYATGGP